MVDLVIDGVRLVVGSRIVAGGPRAPSWLDFSQTTTTVFEVSRGATPQSMSQLTAAKMDDTHVLLLYQESNFGDIRAAVIEISGSTISTVDDQDVADLTNHIQNLALSQIGPRKWLAAGFRAPTSRCLIIEADSTGIISQSAHKVMKDTESGGTSRVSMISDTYGLQIYNLDSGGQQNICRGASFSVGGSPLTVGSFISSDVALTSTSYQYMNVREPAFRLSDTQAYVSIADSVSGGGDPVRTSLVNIRLNSSGNIIADNEREIINQNTAARWFNRIVNFSGSPTIFDIGGLAGAQDAPNRYSVTRAPITLGVTNIGTDTETHFTNASTLNNINMVDTFAPINETWTLISLNVIAPTAALKVGAWTINPTTFVGSFEGSQDVTGAFGGSPGDGFRFVSGQPSANKIIEYSPGKSIGFSVCDFGDSGQGDQFVGAYLLEL